MKPVEKAVRAISGEIGTFAQWNGVRQQLAVERTIARELQRAYLRGLRRAARIADRHNRGGQSDEATAIQDDLDAEIRKVYGR